MPKNDEKQIKKKGQKDLKPSQSKGLAVKVKLIQTDNLNVGRYTNREIRIEATVPRGRSITGVFKQMNTQLRKQRERVREELEEQGYNGFGYKED